jgi:hypothetical protein
VAQSPVCWGARAGGAAVAKSGPTALDVGTFRRAAWRVFACLREYPAEDDGAWLDRIAAEADFEPDPRSLVHSRRGARGQVNDRRAARQAGRRVDPEHFGMSIGYTHQPLDDRRLATLTARLRGRDVDPRTLVPVGYDALRQTLRSFIDVGMSKFVIHPMSVNGSWHQELTGLADTVADLQTSPKINASTKPGTERAQRPSPDIH